MRLVWLKRRMGEAEPRARSGYTLLELMVVIAILGVIAGMTVPLFRETFSRMQAGGIVQDFILTLRTAHERSVFRQEKQDFVIDFEKGKYWFESLQQGKYSKKLKKRAVEVRTLPDRFEFLLVYLPNADEVERKKKLRLSFFPDGTAIDAVILVGKEDRTGEKDYERLDVIKIRGTDSKVSLVEDEEDKNWYEDLL